MTNREFLDTVVSRMYKWDRRIKDKHALERESLENLENKKIQEDSERTTSKIAEILVKPPRVASFSKIAMRIYKNLTNLNNAGFESLG